MKLERLRNSIFVLGVATILALAVSVRAALIIDLPDLVLQPNQAGQAFTFSVQNDGSSVSLNGIQLELIVADGGPQVPGGTIVGPAIRAVSVISSGTLFAGNNTGDRGAGNVFGGATYDQVFQRLTSTSAGTVSVDSGTFLLASIEFDTTGGIPAGQYIWSVASSPNGVSYFTDGNGQIFPSLISGVLTVVPESEYCGMAAGLCALAVALARCFRKSVRLESNWSKKVLGGNRQACRITHHETYSPTNLSRPRRTSHERDSNRTKALPRSRRHAQFDLFGSSRASRDC